MWLLIFPHSIIAFYVLLDQQTAWRWANVLHPKRSKMKNNGIVEKKNYSRTFFHLIDFQND